ncbi:flippase [Thiobacillus denitrificans]|uniref:flippase n=1 Tax=Thiobacillus denitrificans TaxID=36861 RepID=UPI000376254B|nr:flippase [Thiobacillus denitrificans]
MTPIWLKLLPASLRARIEHRPNLQKALTNTGWLLGDKILRMGMGLLVGVWVARYLGPEQFGLMNYAMAIVALFGAVAGLGLNGIVVRDLVQKADGASLTLGTTFLLQLMGGFLAFVLAVVAISVMRPADDLARAMVAILGFALVFKASEVVKYWFESQVRSKYTVWVENGVFLILAAIRVGLILVKAPLLAFVWAALAETALAGSLLLLVYARQAGWLLNWRASRSRAKSLLMESWPLILGSMASMINMRMDQVMLGSMVNNTVVGNYSAAVRLAEVWLIIPGIIGSSIYPSIIAAKAKSEELYRKRILQVTKLMATGVLPAAVIIFLLSDQVVHLIYGQQYAAAGTYLAIYIWTGVPYLVFFVLNQMFYIEGLLKAGFVVSIFSVVSNVLLNFMLIPLYGGIGAAISTLITAVGSTLLSLAILNSKTGIFLNNRK